jgi:hypothetical protein
MVTSRTDKSLALRFHNRSLAQDHSLLKYLNSQASSANTLKR